MAGIVAYLCFKVLEGGFAIKPGQTVTNFSGRSIALAIASFAAGIWLLGPMAGIAIVTGIAILAMLPPSVPPVMMMHASD